MDFVEVGKGKIRELAPNLPKKYPKEVGIAAVIYFGDTARPTWTYDDYIAAFPAPLYRPALIRAYILFRGEKHSSAESTKNQLNYTIESIYPLIVKQMFTSKPPKEFNIESLKETTSKLLQLGNDYGINSGLKARPLITSVACLCALHLRTKMPMKYINRRHKLYKPGNSFYHVWNFKPFLSTSMSKFRYFKKVYSKYYQFLSLCVKQFTWLKQPVDRKRIFFHLDDILSLYLKKDNRKPALEMSPRLFYPSSFIVNLLKTRSVINSLIQAKEYFNNDSDNMEELDEESVTYCMYRLLKEGYSENELNRMSVDEIRNLSDIMDYKLTFENVNERNTDLDRIQIGEDDMCDEEIELYL